LPEPLKPKRLQPKPLQPEMRRRLQPEMRGREPELPERRPRRLDWMPLRPRPMRSRLLPVLSEQEPQRSPPALLNPH
jgi:hypothetical protein